MEGHATPHSSSAAASFAHTPAGSEYSEDGLGGEPSATVGPPEKVPVAPPSLAIRFLSGTIIRGTPKTPKSQLVTHISTKLQRLDGCD
jgi:hypothetical protein